MATGVSGGGTDDYEQRFHAYRIELRACTFPELVERRLLRQRPAVRAFFEHGEKGVRNSDDSCDQRNLVRTEAMRIAGSVPTLMVGSNDLGDVGIHRLADQSLALDGMQVHPLALVECQRAGLREDARVDQKLSDVVEEGSFDNDATHVATEPELIDDSSCALGDTNGMLVGVATAADASRDDAARRLDRKLVAGRHRVLSRGRHVSPFRGMRLRSSVSRQSRGPLACTEQRRRFPCVMT
jgi:hypothetical protein